MFGICTPFFTTEDLSSNAEGLINGIPSVRSYTDIEIGRILGSVPGDASSLVTPSGLKLQRQYENVSKRHVTMELHFITLREYYKERYEIFTTAYSIC